MKLYRLLGILALMTAMFTNTALAQPTSLDDAQQIHAINDNAKIGTNLINKEKSNMGQQNEHEQADTITLFIRDNDLSLNVMFCLMVLFCLLIGTLPQAYFKNSPRFSYAKELKLVKIFDGITITLAVTFVGVFILIMHYS